MTETTSAASVAGAAEAGAASRPAKRQAAGGFNLSTSTASKSPQAAGHTGDGDGDPAGLPKVIRKVGVFTEGA